MSIYYLKVHIVPVWERKGWDQSQSAESQRSHWLAVSMSNCYIKTLPGINFLTCETEAQIRSLKYRANCTKVSRCLGRSTVCPPPSTFSSLSRNYESKQSTRSTVTKPPKQHPDRRLCPAPPANTARSLREAEARARMASTIWLPRPLWEVPSLGRWVGAAEKGSWAWARERATGSFSLLLLPWLS